jgi:hypothetical protein
VASSDSEDWLHHSELFIYFCEHPSILISHSSGDTVCRISSLLWDSHEAPLQKLVGAAHFTAKITGERKITSVSHTKEVQKSGAGSCIKLDDL